jgi:hypothetical protein
LLGGANTGAHPDPEVDDTPGVALDGHRKRGTCLGPEEPR